MNNKIILLIAVLFVCIKPNIVNANKIYEFNTIRFLSDENRHNWLKEQTYSNDYAMLLNYLNEWSEKYRKKNKWNDFLLVENEIANIEYLNNKEIKAFNRLKLSMFDYAGKNDTISIEYAYSKLLCCDLNPKKVHYAISSLDQSIKILKQLNHKSELYSYILYRAAAYNLAYNYKEKAIDYIRELENQTEISSLLKLNKDALLAKLFAINQPNFSYQLMKNVVNKIEKDSLPLSKTYLGSYYISLGYYSKKMNHIELSNTYYHNALQILKNQNDHLSEIIANQNLASNNIGIGNYEMAKSYIQKVDSIAQVNNSDHGKYVAFDLTGYLFEKQKLYDSAYIYYLKSKDLVVEKNPKAYSLLGKIYNYLSAASYYSSDYIRAVNHARMSIYAYCGYNTIDTSYTSLNISTLNSNVDFAMVRALEKYIASLNKTYQQSKNILYAEELFKASKYLDTLLFKQLDIVVDKKQVIRAKQKVIRSFDKAIEIGHQLYCETRQTEFAFNSINNLENLKSKVLFLEKNSFIANSLKGDSLTKLINNKTLELNNVKNALDSSFLEMQLLALKKSLYQSNLKKLLANNNLDYNNNFIQIDSLFLKKIDKNNSIVVYHKVDSNLYAFVLNHNAIDLKQIKLPQNFDQLTKLSLRSIKTNAGNKQALHKISSILIDPIHDLTNDHINFILADELSNLPFECLYFNNQQLINNKTISYGYSLNLWHESNVSRVNKNKDILIVAPSFANNNHLAANIGAYRNITFIDTTSMFRNGNLIKLPFAKIEAQEIENEFRKNNLKHYTFLGEQATELNIRQNLNKNTIIHFATHGIVSDNYDMHTGLFLTMVTDNDYTNNGFLSLNELYNLNINANLAVLSACKTGTGKIVEGEGVMALPRGFIYAGVPNVIASLWKVHDEKTKDLMVAFYKHLLDDKVSYAEALRLAKLECIEKGFLPMDWAGFVLIGN